MWTKLRLLMAMVTCLAGDMAAQGIIDVHCHGIPPFYVDELERHDAALDEGFPLPSWDAAAHLEFMDEAGIGCSILSMPAPQLYFGDAGECRSVTRRYNEHCAKLKAEHPGRFRFCASLPLPDVDAAIAEAIYALDTLGADGVKLATNSRGQYLGDEALDPLMQVLDERGAVIIIHPHKPSPVNGGLMEAVPLAVQEYPAETTRAVLNMLAHGVLVRYPHLRVVVPHCGSFLPLAIPRLKSLMPALLARGMMGGADVDAGLARLYYDMAGAASPSVLRTLLTITTPDHVLYGSDYPYQPAGVLAGRLRRLREELSRDVDLSPYAGMFLWENAARLFDIPLAEGVAHEPATVHPEPGAGEDGTMLVRISEIEVYPEHLDDYLSFALEVGATSVREEPGVIAIFPMVQQRDSCQVRILEIYASREAYEHHITTPHFQAYKRGTLHMVKSLDLVDMSPMNPATMPAIFLKMKGGECDGKH